MKSLDVALCDSCEDYILKFASYLMDKINVGIHIFTTTESFYSDDSNYDVAIMTEEFKEISEFKPKGVIGHRYFLTENMDSEEANEIYKFQAVSQIIDEIVELRQLKSAGTSIRKSNEKSKMIGVYSPISHELQLPFSMALGQGNKINGRVLFLDLEEISILPKLVGKTCDRNLMDLLYEIDANTSEKIDLNDYVRSFMGFDYIEPFINPNEISEIESDTWMRFFDTLRQANYDVIVVLFGRTINGFARCIEMLDKLYVLGKPGDYYKKGQEVFCDYIERIDVSIDMENVILPMSAGNLSDNSYHIEELLQGNLGVFVKRLINANGQKVKQIYG